MSINQIQKVFNYEGANVRTVIIDGEPWFVAKDVCEVLEIRTNNLRTILDSDEISTLKHNDYTIDIGLGNVLNKRTIGIDVKTVVPEAHNGGKELLIINEPGIYSLVLKSRKPEAKKFKRWVTHEVLPSIRKHGMYMTDEVARIAIDNKEEFLSRAILIAKETIDAIQNQLDEAKPKVLFANAVSASITSISIADLAKILKQNGIKTGQNRLFAWLRENGYLMKAGYDRNMPTQKAMEMQLFEIKESTFQDTTAIRISKTTKVTGKGQVYFVNLLKKNSA